MYSNLLCPLPKPVGSIPLRWDPGYSQIKLKNGSAELRTKTRSLISVDSLLVHRVLFSGSQSKMYVLSHQMAQIPVRPITSAPDANFLFLTKNTVSCSRNRVTKITVLSFTEWNTGGEESLFNYTINKHLIFQRFKWCRGKHLCKHFIVDCTSIL